MTDFLVVDIGNSAVKAGRFEGSDLAATTRSAVTGGTCDLEGDFARFLRQEPFSAAAVTSVVPGLTGPVVSRIEQRTGQPALVVDASAKMPFAVAYETPATLGADRLAAAAAAWTWAAVYRPRSRVVLAVDAGTALNIEVVVATPDGPVYLGGVIAPGPELIRRALRTGTAQLPDVPLEWPAEIVGSTTRSAIQAGILPGFVHAVDGILQQIEQELGSAVCAVATGGWAGLLMEHLPRIERADPDLVLRGIREIAAINVRP